MTTILVTQHPSAMDWLKHCERPVSGETEECSHFQESDLERVKSGDIVAGPLPIHIIAAINARGGRYFHIEMTVPEEIRIMGKKNYTRAEMEEYGARLVEYRAERAGVVTGDAQ